MKTFQRIIAELDKKRQVQKEGMKEWPSKVDALHSFIQSLCDIIKTFPENTGTREFLRLQKYPRSYPLISMSEKLKQIVDDDLHNRSLVQEEPEVIKIYYEAGIKRLIEALISYYNLLKEENQKTLAKLLSDKKIYLDSEKPILEKQIVRHLHRLTMSESPILDLCDKMEKASESESKEDMIVTSFYFEKNSVMSQSIEKTLSNAETIETSRSPSLEMVEVSDVSLDEDVKMKLSKS